MKYLTEFRNGEIAQRMAREIHQITTRPWRIMEVCGGQTHSIIRNGIDQMLPAGIDMIHGPGCPVCVTPLSLIDKALAIASQPGVIFCARYRSRSVPGKRQRRRCSGCLFAARCGGIGRPEPRQASRLFWCWIRDYSTGQCDERPPGKTPRTQKLLSPRFACAGTSGNRSHHELARQQGSGVSRRWPCLQRHGLLGVPTNNREVPDSHHRHRL
jgi:hypothetical protein